MPIVGEELRLRAPATGGADRSGPDREVLKRALAASLAGAPRRWTDRSASRGGQAYRSLSEAALRAALNIRGGQKRVVANGGGAGAASATPGPCWPFGPAISRPAMADPVPSTSSATRLFTPCDRVERAGACRFGRLLSVLHAASLHLFATVICLQIPCRRTFIRQIVIAFAY